MDPSTIIGAIEAGVSLFNSVEQAIGQKPPPKVQAVLDAGAAIVQTATNLYNTVKAELAANDQASVDAALANASAQLQIDFTRTEQEILHDAQKG